jgi:hypothetical protein
MGFDEWGEGDKKKSAMAGRETQPPIAPGL